MYRSAIIIIYNCVVPATGKFETKICFHNNRVYEQYKHSKIINIYPLLYS